MLVRIFLKNRETFICFTQGEVILIQVKYGWQIISSECTVHSKQNFQTRLLTMRLKIVGTKKRLEILSRIREDNLVKVMAAFVFHCHETIPYGTQARVKL